ncbi:MAG: YicC/YloC family endoribonuclease, partial [Hyphomicrobium sp.]
MSIKSMTGFARTEGALGAVRWHWEIRSVNGRGLDFRFRLPPGLDALEPKLREAVQKKLARGSINATLTLQREASTAAIRLNEAALMQVVAAADRAAALTGGERPSVEALLAVRGVLEVAEAEDASSEALGKALLMSFDAALEALIAARATEGGRLADILGAQVAEIETLVAAAAASPARSTEAIAKRLAEQVAKLVDAAPALDPVRLHQEAALIATRADIEEEVKRLGAHIAAARELVAAREPVGRKLEFLAQEFNREANTLCSKANDPEITRGGLALKAVIDQL